jgi:integrase
VFLQIGMDGYSVHGLRKNAAVTLAEVGCEPHEIMAITGHKTLAMITHYTKRANQKRLADRAMEKWKAGSKT